MPSDKFYPTPVEQLLKMMLTQYKSNGRIFGIPEALFFRPSPSDPFRTKRFGQLLETPIGLAAGPHTQLTQNIVAGWLTGARFIELKTIQTLDELEISKPCIDMQDEGYNCEWSQELKIEDSFGQYLDAWILIHVLKDFLGIGTPEQPGFIFNISVGYDLKGILNENVQRFINKMQDASAELNARIKKIKPVYPGISKFRISPKISDNITLSTMHGCPPDEIEAIGIYLLENKHLHTTIKLNPTLLGKDRVNEIISSSGFDTKVPDQAFEHDLKYADAVQIIFSLCQTASMHDLRFGIKLTNTLESINHKEVFPSNEKMMYMSGRALHPVSVALALKIQKDFGGRFNLSFSGGADAFNIANLVACGLDPVTVCSDLLKPGGYGRLHQYIEELRIGFNLLKASDIGDFVSKKAGSHEMEMHLKVLRNLENYNDSLKQDERYRKTGFHVPSIKTVRPLGLFDCIHAPCEDTCPTNQDIPNYNFHTAQSDFLAAAEVIRQTNPFPYTTGMICDHLCQLKCTRINYDHPVLIREIKRFVTENELNSEITSSYNKIKGPGKKAAIIGAGPSGLSCAAFLAKAGFQADVYETKKQPGGMVASGIPAFRLTEQAIQDDVDAILTLGVNIHYGQKISREHFEIMEREYDYIYIATGAQRSVRLNIPGADSDGVLDPLHFLETLKDGSKISVGERVLIIGGGNTAMDVARTAIRVADGNSKVTILYRRTKREMPADLGEIKAVMQEGIEIFELVAPVKVNVRDGKAISLTCIRMEHGPKDESGRPRPVEVPGSEFEIEADTIIPAVGQELAIDFCDPALLKAKPGSYETKIPQVFIGGDALRGASTAINAIGDGRKAAQEIIDRVNAAILTKPENTRIPKDLSSHMQARARKMKPVRLQETPLSDRKNFQLVSSTITQDEAVYEASRCLLCDEVCNICTTVCPNLAFHSYQIQPISIKLQKLVRKNGIWEIEGDDEQFEIKQQLQILHIADWCNNCGNCNTFCPSSGAPYKAKPHFFLSREAFEAENEGYWLEITNGKKILHQKSNGSRSKLVEEGDRLVYEFESNYMVLDRTNLEIIEFKISDFEGEEMKLSTIVELKCILAGALSLMERG